ncbi:SUEL-type lectin domain-containing protein [Entamoeba marina]
MLLFFVLLISTYAARQCFGRIYYIPDCVENSLSYIGETSDQCKDRQIGLESVGIHNNITSSYTITYLDICGNDNLQYCILVDYEGYVYYSTASGSRSSSTCNTSNKKFITNLCTCPYELNTKCVNTQYFKVAHCIKNFASIISPLLLLPLLFIML